jgi:hypothetical protein
VKVVGLLVRLCAASFTQGSFYLHRRVAWPAHIPRKKPSLDELSFRIIDIGSGLCPSVNCSTKSFAVEVKGERRTVAISRLGLDTEGLQACGLASAIVPPRVFGNKKGIDVTCCH